MWIVSLVISTVCLLCSVILAIIQIKSQHWRTDSSKFLFIGVVISSVVLFLPIYLNIFKTSGCGIFETILIAIHNTIRLFVVDGEFEFITSNINGVSEPVYRGYTILFSILFVLAPVLTFGFVLSFFKNISAYERYISRYYTDVFVFSKLNDKSLALAQSLYNNNSKDRLFIFTDVFEDDEANYELQQKAKKFGAICFKKDITDINFSFHSKKRDLTFFTIGEDQSENISQALNIFEKFKSRDNTHLYVFSTLIESELLLSNIFNSESENANNVKIKVRRVNMIRSLITRNLYENGYEKIFSSAVLQDNKKLINALVVGMGQYGTEMTKALAWFCQMDGYKVQIDSVDINENANDDFSALCPELMDSKLNGNYDIEGEAKYKITVHSNVNVETNKFEDIILTLTGTTYVLVALGNDEKNISTAVKLRSLFAKMGYYPEIQAIVYDTNKREALADIKNFKGQNYNIDFIGDIRTSYSEEEILDSNIEEEALERHLKWGNENEFWQFEYNYKSSIASIIHRKMKKLCGIPGIFKESHERTKEELRSLRILEHCRWNAYMRSEGYTYGGTVEKSGRNDLAKTHNCLVPFSHLPINEQEKDDY